MATEKSTDIGSVSADETTTAQENSGTTSQVSNTRAWYTYLNEDWLATIFGLILVILLVVGLLHSIP